MSEGIERTWPTASEVSSSIPQKVVHVVERLAPGGIETLVLDLISRTGGSLAFSLQGDRQELIDRWPALKSISAQVEAFDRKGLDVALIPRLARSLRHANAKTVFLHHIGPLLYGGLAAQLAGVSRVIFVEHDAWHYESWIDQLLARGLVRLLRARLVAVSQQVAGRLSAIVPGREVHVIPPGIDTERFAPGDKSRALQLLGLDPSWRIVGSVGRLQPVKGHRFLVEALKELPSDIHAVLVGDGVLQDDLKQLTARLSLDERVHLIGHRDDLNLIYPAFDVFCLPSLSEGLPRTLLEAQASGVPVVATNVGGVPEAVCTVTGMTVPPGDAKALAIAIEQALKRVECSESPRSFVVDRMSLTDTVEHYRQLAEA